MTRTVLIVDDIAVNRRMLTGILSAEYQTCEAEDGRAALRVLEARGEEISAVLLDIQMPELDGYGVLRVMRKDPLLSKIPVIITTGSLGSSAENQAFLCGANDFITKPYDSETVRHRLWNLINLRETSAIVNSARLDDLTGMYNRNTFFSLAGELLSAHEPGYYVLACFDIDNFKIINDQYGNSRGDAVLRHIADVFRHGFDPAGGLCSRISADNFAVLYPRALLDTKTLSEIRKEACTPGGDLRPLTFSIGRYIADDLSLSVSAMYDRATLAKRSVKGRFDKHIALYDESMRTQLLYEQAITGEMKHALETGQFEVWYQPQFNHSTGALIGAEALVRWRHPQDGLLIAPGRFIPVFEKNGFIYELDKYIWEQVCRQIRFWLDTGRPPLPVSVNISRYDVFCEDFVPVITGLVEQYHLPVSLLRLEITETAFAKSTEQIVSVVRKLIDHGFTVEIDDFGSGYSSLNTLKDVPAQVLKLDLRFLEDDGGSQRGGNILESVVRMSKWLGMSVIAEGVESTAQADYLKSIGCNYVQGYLYASPMPADAYTDVIARAEKEENLLVMETVETLDNSAFWDPDSMDTLIFNTFVGAACIFEWHKNHIEVLRANENYAKVLGGESCSIADALALNWEAHMDAQTAAAVRAAIEKTADTGEEVTFEAAYNDLFDSGETTILRTTFRAIARTSDRLLVYATNINLTAQRKAEQRILSLNNSLQSLMNDMPGGFVRLRVLPDGRLVADYVNEPFCRLRGMTHEQIMTTDLLDAMLTVHPDDRERVREIIGNMLKTGQTASIRYRHKRADGTYEYVNAFGRVSRTADGEPYINAYYSDMSEEEKRELSLRETVPYVLSAIMENAADLVFAKDKDFRYICCSPAFVRFTGQKSEQDVIGRTDYDFWTKEEADRFRNDDVRLFEGGEPLIDFIEPIPSDDGAQHYCKTSKYILRDATGGIIGMYGIGRDITAERATFEQLKLLTDSMPCGLATYALMPEGLKLIYFNDGLCHMFGCTREEYALSASSDVMTAVHPEDVPQLAEQIERMIREGTPVDCTYRITTRRGLKRWVNLRATPAERIGGRLQAHAVLYDVTAQKDAALSVGRPAASDDTSTQAAARLRAILGSIRCGMSATAIVDGSVRYLFTNDAFYAMFGYTEDAFIALMPHGMRDLIVPEDLTKLDRAVADTERNGQAEIELRARRKDGSVIWVRNVSSIGHIPGIDTPVYIVMSTDVTREHEAVDALRISETQFRIAASLSGKTIARFDVKARTYHHRDPFLLAQGLPEAIPNMPQALIDRGVITAAYAPAYLAFYDRIFRGEQTSALDTALRTPQGSIQYIHADATTVFDADGAPVQAVIVFSDTTLQREKEAVYSKWQQSLKQRKKGSYTLFRCNLSRDASFDRAEGSLLSICFSDNAGSFDDRTRSYADAFVCVADREAYLSFLRSDALLGNFYRGVRAKSLEYREKCSDGTTRWLLLTVELVEYPDSTDVEAYLLYEDIDVRKKAELLTRARADTDPLTGLFNRAAFSLAVEHKLSQPDAGDGLTLMILDMDGFKLINDTFGHAEGDRALVDMAHTLKGVLRSGDLAGRLGGDEFMICLSGMPDDASIAHKARKICALLHRSLTADMYTSVSIGIAVCPRDGVDFETLYRNADAALYAVKARGKNGFGFSDRAQPESDAPAVETPVFPAAARAASPRRLLIVDDSEISLRMLSGIFESEYTIETARSGAEALLCLKRFGSNIDAMLLDLVMPNTDGFMVLESMRESEYMQSIPVIVVSGLDEQETSLRAIRCGASEYVTKPVDPDLIRLRVRSVISRAENDRLRAQNSVLIMHNAEIARYRAALLHTGAAIAEYEPASGKFFYDSSVSTHLWGVYDDRALWDILSADGVAAAADAGAVRALIMRTASGEQEADGDMTVMLRTPEDRMRSFRIYACRNDGTAGFPNRIILTLIGK